MITLARIQSGIERELGAIGEFVEAIAKAADNEAQTEAAYKSAFAKARLQARTKGEYERVTVGQVDDEATVATADLHLAYLIAANHLTATREALRASQARLDGLRSLLSSFKLAGG